MRFNDYGPVPISQIKAESSQIFQALADHRRVLVSKHGVVVAAIDPPSEEDRDVLMFYAMPESAPLPELTATVINQGSPSQAISRAEEGTPSYVTRGDKVYGILRSITPAELADDGLTLKQIRERERQVSEYLSTQPNAIAEDLVTFTADVTQSLTGDLVGAVPVGGRLSDDELAYKVIGVLNEVSNLNETEGKALIGTVPAAHLTYLLVALETVLTDLAPVTDHTTKGVKQR